MDDNRTVTAVFTWTDEAPEFAADATPFTARFMVGAAGSIQLPEATGGNGDLTYSPSSIPAGLEFDSATAVLARKATTMGTMVAGTTTATLTVHDEDDNRASTDADTVTVTIAVTAATRPPDTTPPTDMRCRVIVTAGSGGSATCALTMTANKTASITFERITHTLTVTAGAGGSVSPSGTTTQYEGDVVTLTASWNDATHSFTGWGGDCSGTTSTCKPESTDRQG